MPNCAHIQPTTEPGNSIYPLALLPLSLWPVLSIPLPKPWCLTLVVLLLYIKLTSSSSQTLYNSSVLAIQNYWKGKKTNKKKQTTKNYVTVSSDTWSRSAKPLQIWKTNSLTDGPHKVYNMCSVGGSMALGEKQKTGNLGAQSFWIFCFFLIGRSHKLIVFSSLTWPDTLTFLSEWGNKKKKPIIFFS